MMLRTIRISEDTYVSLKRHVEQHLPREVGALLLVGHSKTRDNENLLVRRSILLGPDAFEVQETYRLVMKPSVINGAIGLCEANGLGIVFCHSHPADIPYSKSDDFGEARLREVFEQCLPNVPFGSLLVCPTMMFGRIWRTPKSHEPIHSLRVIGSLVRDYRLNGVEDEPTATEDEFDRQIRAFGSAGQQMLSRIRVGIVGVGGTGSPTAEQLIRLGTRDLLLIDRDIVDETSLTRCYGTFRDAIRKEKASESGRAGGQGQRTHKVTTIANHLLRIAPDARIEAVVGDVAETRVAQMLLDRDVVFSCVDEHWGRAILNQIAYQYLVPTINLGVRIDVDRSQVIGAAGAIQVLRPGSACLWCAAFLSSERIRSESLSADHRESLKQERYVVGLGEPAPSVISFTTALSALAVTEYIQLITGFLGSTGGSKRLNYFISESTVRPGETSIRAECICGRVFGRGDLLELPTVESRPS
jgi:molybdopterin/thiamine biosynthesis adenylyltransferase